MKIDDQRILDVMDKEWRTLADIRGRLNSEIPSFKLAAALGRLVDQGSVEKRLQGDAIPRSRGGMALAIGLFRRSSAL